MSEDKQSMNTTNTTIELSEEDKKRRNRRSVAIALGLVFLVILFYVMTVFKFGPDIMNRPL